MYREGGSLEPKALPQKPADEIKAWLAGIPWDTENNAVKLKLRD
jgi:hypothetical protein